MLQGRKGKGPFRQVDYSTDLVRVRVVVACALSSAAVTIAMAVAAVAITVFISVCFLEVGLVEARVLQKLFAAKKRQGNKIVSKTLAMSSVRCRHDYVKSIKVALHGDHFSEEARGERSQALQVSTDRFLQHVVCFRQKTTKKKDMIGQLKRKNSFRKH